MPRWSVALINPSAMLLGSERKLEPVALTYLGGALEARGRDVSIFDFEVLLETQSEDEIVAAISKFDVVGFSFYSYVLPSKFGGLVDVPIVDVYSLIPLVRKANSTALILMGGPGVPGAEQKLLREIPELDILLRGEAERTLPDLLDALEVQASLDEIPGIVFRDSSCSTLIRDTGGRPQLPNLDELAPPARHLLQDRHRYRWTVVSSRGCPHGCTFCQPEINNRFRARSAEAVVKEVEELVVGQNAWYIDFVDPNFSAFPARAEAIADSLKLHFPELLFSVTVTSNVLCKRPSLAPKLKSAGCLTINIGLESFLQSRLDKWFTGKRRDYHLKAISALRANKQGFAGSLILFDQDTTVDDLRIELETIEMLDMIDFVDEYSNRMRFFTGSTINSTGYYQDWSFKDARVEKVYQELQSLLKLQSDIFTLRNLLLAGKAEETDDRTILLLGLAFFGGLCLVKQAEHSCLAESIWGEVSGTESRPIIGRLLRLKSSLATMDPSRLDSKDFISQELQIKTRDDAYVIRRDPRRYMVVGREMGRLHSLNNTSMLLLESARGGCTIGDAVTLAARTAPPKERSKALWGAFAALAHLHTERLIDAIPHISPSTLHSYSSCQLGTGVSPS